MTRLPRWVLNPAVIFCPARSDGPGPSKKLSHLGRRCLVLRGIRHYVPVTQSKKGSRFVREQNSRNRWRKECAKVYAANV